MSKVRGVYQGFLALSFMFVVVVFFICICSLRCCTDDCFVKNLIIGYSAEAILFICGICFIRKGSAEILKETRSLKVLKEFCIMVLLLVAFGMVFSLILLVFPYGVFGQENWLLEPVLICALNIFLAGLIFFVWMTIKIIRINKRMRY